MLYFIHLIPFLFKFLSYLIVCLTSPVIPESSYCWAVLLLPHISSHRWPCVDLHMTNKAELELEISHSYSDWASSRWQCLYERADTEEEEEEDVPSWDALGIHRCHVSHGPLIIINAEWYNIWIRILTQQLLARLIKTSESLTITHIV